MADLYTAKLELDGRDKGTLHRLHPTSDNAACQGSIDKEQLHDLLPVMDGQWAQRWVGSLAHDCLRAGQPRPGAQPAWRRSF